MRFNLKHLLAAGSIALLAACNSATLGEQGWNAYTAGDFNKARSLMEQGIEVGDRTAFNNLGMLYRDGAAGYPKDLNKAKELFTKSAELDYSFAYNNLALMSELGWAGPKDLAFSAEYYQKAADTAVRDGNFYAFDNLGRMYENGWGVEKDLDKAIELYKRSAGMGYSTAKGNLDRLGVAY